MLDGAALADVAPDADVEAALAEETDPEAAVLIVLITLAVLNILAALDDGATEVVGSTVVLGASEVLTDSKVVVGTIVELGAAGLELARTLLRISNWGVKLTVLVSCSSMISSA